MHVCVCVCVCVCVWLCRASLIQLHTPSIASSPAIGASYSSPCAFSYLAYTLTLTPSPSHPHPHTLTLTLAYQLSHLAPTHTNSSHTFAPTRYTCTHYILESRWSTAALKWKRNTADLMHPVSGGSRSVSGGSRSHAVQCKSPYMQVK